MFKLNVQYFFILALCAMLISPAKAQDKVVDQVVAVVGANIILKSDIEGQYLQMQAQGMISDGDQKCEILEDFLVQKLLLAEAELDTMIIVTDSQVNSEMDRRMQMFFDRIGSEKEIEKRFGKPIARIRADLDEVIRDQQMTTQMQSKITGDVNFTPAEVRQYYKTLSEDEIPMIPQQLEYAQITIVPTVTESEELRVKTKLRELKKRAEEGTTFSTLAVIYSEGPSASKGGEIGYLGRGELDPAYAAVAFNLRPGQVSKVVKSDFGYHIIQLVDRKGEKVNTRHILMKPKVDPSQKVQAEARLDSISDFIREDKLIWDQAAYLYSSDKDTKNSGGLTVNPMTMSSKFDIDQLGGAVSKVLTKMEVNEISEPFWVQDDRKGGHYKIVKLISRSEKHKATPQADYQYLAEIFLGTKKEEIFKQWVSELQSKTYIRIDPSYANCNFMFENWVK